MGETPDDIDPALLSETGRASAIQDLADQANRLNDRAEAIEETTVSELVKRNRVLLRQNRIQTYAIIVLVVLGMFQNYRSVFVSSPKINSIQATVEGPLTVANGKLDDICAFIKEVSSRSETPIKSNCDDITSDGEKDGN